MADLERLISDLKRQLDDEIKKQKLSSEALLEELVVSFFIQKKETDRKIRELEEKLAKSEKRAETAESMLDTLRGQLK